MAKGLWADDIKARNGCGPGPYILLSEYDALLAENAALAAEMAETKRALAIVQDTSIAHAGKQNARIAALEAENARLLADVNQDEGYERLKARCAQLEAAAHDLLQYLDEHDWGYVPEGATADRLRDLVTPLETGAKHEG